jgi:hypothetical protein
VSAIAPAFINAAAIFSLPKSAPQFGNAARQGKEPKIPTTGRCKNRRRIVDGDRSGRGGGGTKKKKKKGAAAGERGEEGIDGGCGGARRLLVVALV